MMKSIIKLVLSFIITLHLVGCAVAVSMNDVSLISVERNNNVNDDNAPIRKILAKKIGD